MLRIEDIGRLRFDPSGQIVIFERNGPYGDMAEFGRLVSVGEPRSKLYMVDLRTEVPPRPLFEQRSEDGYLLGSYSPSGKRVSYWRLSPGALAIGVYDLVSHKTVEFDFTPQIVWGDRAERLEPAWISETKLVCAVAEEGRLPLWYDLFAERLERLSAAWRATRLGRESTASAVGSGRFVSAAADRTGGLIVADAVTGKSHRLGDGDFLAWSGSPSGRFVAAIRGLATPMDPDSRLPLAGGATTKGELVGYRGELVIYDLDDAGRARIVCEGCDVMRNRLDWSPHGHLLSFYARGARPALHERGLWIFDLRSRKTHRVDLAGLALRFDETEDSSSAAWAWVGDNLVVDATAQAGQAIAGSYLLKPGAVPLNLTAGFGRQEARMIGADEDELFVLCGGKVWRISSDLPKTPRLVASLAQQSLRDWRLPTQYGARPAMTTVPQVGRLVLETMASETEPNDGSRRLTFVDFAGKSLRSVVVSDDESSVLDATAKTQRAIIRGNRDNVGTLDVIEPSGRNREIFRFNLSLRGVVGGQPVRINYKGIDGDDLIAWLLLPPGFRPGKPVPTIVNVYAGDMQSATWKRWNLWDMTPLNDHLLAAHGYAVLYPSIPLDENIPRDPLANLADKVLAAVDAAVLAGFVDPDRLAIQGQSFGAYTTVGILGQTNRFKAGVAQAGIYELVGNYGTFDAGQRVTADFDGPDLHLARLSESGQFGMGVPPWRDVDRYVRNSPLMHVEKVDTPLLLIHGDQDFVSITQAEELFTAMYRLNKDAILVRYWGEEHQLHSPQNIRDMWQRIFAWYDENLQAARDDPAVQRLSRARITIAPAR